MANETTAGVRKRIHVGRFDYTIDETDKTFKQLQVDIAEAQTNGAVLAIDVLDDNDRQLVLLVNFGIVDVVALDSGEGNRPGGPRPTEISAVGPPPAV